MIFHNACQVEDRAKSQVPNMWCTSDVSPSFPIAWFLNENWNFMYRIHIVQLKFPVQNKYLICQINGTESLNDNWYFLVHNSSIQNLATTNRACHCKFYAWLPRCLSPLILLHLSNFFQHTTAIVSPHLHDLQFVHPLLSIILIVHSFLEYSTYPQVSV